MGKRKAGKLSLDMPKASLHKSVLVLRSLEDIEGRLGTGGRQLALSKSSHVIRQTAGQNPGSQSGILTSWKSRAVS